MKSAEMIEALMAENAKLLAVVTALPKCAICGETAIYWGPSWGLASVRCEAHACGAAVAFRYRDAFLALKKG